MPMNSPSPSSIARAIRAATSLPARSSRTSSSTSPPCMHAQYQAQHLSHRSCSRPFHTSVPSCAVSRPPKSGNRGPASKETTQTDFGAMDVLGTLAAPTTAIDATTSDGFSLNSGTRVVNCGVLLLGGEAFRWRPWIREGRKEGTIGGGGTANDAGSAGGVGKLRNEKGMWECDKGAWGVLDLVWPKPDLLILGTGSQVVPVSPATRKHINDLGIRLEIADTRNAAAQFNLLATERGVQQVAAALVPLGWKEGK